MKVEIGTDGPDLIQSPAGRSIVRALAGDDTVNAAPEQADTYFLDSHIDPDHVYLGSGDDVARGFQTHDMIFGGRGDDDIEAGFDYIWGGYSGKNSVFGQGGNDRIHASGLLDGGAGDDTLIGNGRMVGGGGDDVYECALLRGNIIDRQGTSDITVDQSWNDSYTSSAIHRIVTGGGKDIITLVDVSSARINSGDRADIIKNFSWLDPAIIHGGKGNDQIYAGGNDLLFGGNGRDTIAGGIVKAGRDNDSVFGANSVNGGLGNDTIATSSDADGGAGDDLIIRSENVWGREGNDIIKKSENVWGGVGDDFISQSENVWGGDGDDLIRGSMNARGEAGDDRVGGGGLLRGDNGNDTLQGSTLGIVNDPEQTDDTLEGGRGADELRFAFGEGEDILRGGGGPDTYVLTRFVPDDPPFLVTSYDTIEGFQQNLDLIDVRARDGITSFDDLTIEQAGDFVLVKDDPGYVLVILEDQLATDFTAEDFIF